MKKFTIIFLSALFLAQTSFVFAQGVPETDLSYGTKGEVVKQLQTTLRALGYFTEESTGNFFSKTA